MTIESHNFCTVFNQRIDDNLVNVKKPACIKEMNGCGNCPKIGYRMISESSPGPEKKSTLTESEESVQRIEKLKYIAKRLRIRRGN